MANARILVVEDEAIVAKDVQSRLEGLGYAVPAIASSGEEAIGKAAETQPDLVLMDVRLRGEMDGVEAAGQVRDRFNIPVIYVTAYADDATLQRAKITQPFGYILKPFETRELHTAIEMALYKHKLEESLRKSRSSFRSLVEKNPDGILLVDKDGITRYVNPAVESFLNRTSEELIGELFGLPLVGGQLTEIDVVRRGAQPGIAELRVDGTEWEGKPAQLVSIRDVTERKRTEEELARQAETLARANAELEDFTYVVSHDLKEPLRGIAAFSTFLDEDYGDKLDDEGRRYIRVVREGAVRMKRLIEDLLELSRIGRVDAKYETVPAESLLSEARAHLGFAIEEQNVDLRIQPDLPSISCDPTRMTEVFKNLISNAIKFTDKPEVVVDIACSRNNGFYTFSVQDNGIGIEDQHREKVFQIFQRLNRREEYEGTGAGLTICKKVVESHGGTIWVESKIGEGTTFSFTIPISEEKPNGRTAETS